MYSAIKVGGKKLYELARKGQEVARKPRSITIYELELLEQVSETDYLLRCLCSKGTYIRTLCHDIRPGPGLRRHAVQPPPHHGGRLYGRPGSDAGGCPRPQGESLLLPTDSLFADHPILLLKSDKVEKRVRCGNPITLPGTPDGTYRIYSQDRQFLCLSQARDGTLTSLKNFFGA